MDICQIDRIRQSMCFNEINGRKDNILRLCITTNLEMVESGAVNKKNEDRKKKSATFKVQNSRD